MEEIAIGQEFVTKQENNLCFGCSQSNAHGLRMRFVRTGEKTFESHYTVDEHFCGPPGVVQGGVQAVLLDEVMGVAAGSAGDGPYAVTTELTLRYRRPVPTGKPLVIRAEVVRFDGKDLYLEGWIGDASEERCTVATGRFRPV